MLRLRPESARLTGFLFIAPHVRYRFLQRSITGYALRFASSFASIRLE